MKSKLDNYNFFYEIVKNNSFSKAAEKLYVSQSSVSQALNRLETDLGVTLIERTTKKMKLTTAGDMLYKQVSKSIDAIKHAEQNIEDIINLKIGKLDIAVNDTICRYFLMPKLSRFMDKNDSISVKIINRPSKSSLSALENGIVDIAAVNKIPGMSYRDYNTILEFEYNEVLIASKDKDFSHIKTKDDLKSDVMIVLEKGTTTRKLIDYEFVKDHISFNPKIEVTSVDLIFDFVKNGYGIGVVPDYAFDFYDGIVKIDGLLPIQSRRIALITKKNHPISIATKSFIDSIVSTNEED